MGCWRASRIATRDLVAIANGGSAESANFDDGDLNYDKGIVSNMLQTSGEIAARWGFLGVYVRGIAYYDFETELCGSRAHRRSPATPITTSASAPSCKTTTSTRASRSAACPCTCAWETR